MSLIPDSKLDFWIKHYRNVLLSGKHGVGKTAMIKSAFDRNNIKFLYFSCSTLDPWVDFVGIPKEAVGEDGTVYLDMVRPKAFAYDEVEAIFLDELNRAPKKVMNAVMELLQFKSINGKKFNNLKMVWAAINPPPVDKNSTIYHVEDLDPAIITRFHVNFPVVFDVSVDFFRSRFEEHADQAERACDFWKVLDPKLKDDFPPRSLEYALEMYFLGGDVEDSLPACISKKQFIKALDEPVITIKNGKEKTKIGETTNVSFVNADYTSLVQSTRDRKGFGTALSKLSNEEFLILFKKNCVTAADSVSTVASVMIEEGTNEQIISLIHLLEGKGEQYSDGIVTNLLQKIGRVTEKRGISRKQIDNFDKFDPPQLKIKDYHKLWNEEYLLKPHSTSSLFSK